MGGIGAKGRGKLKHITDLGGEGHSDFARDCMRK